MRRSLSGPKSMNWALRYISSSSVKAFERDCNYDMKKQNHKFEIHHKGIKSQIPNWCFWCIHRYTCLKSSVRYGNDDNNTLSAARLKGVAWRYDLTNLKINISKGRWRLSSRSHGWAANISVIISYEKKTQTINYHYQTPSKSTSILVNGLRH